MFRLWKWASSDLRHADEAVGLPSSSTLLWKPKPQLTWRWNKALKAEGSARTQGIQFLSFTADPSLLLLLTPPINQPSKGADWERFTVAQWQLCCSEPTNHPGSFISCLKVPLRALLPVVLLALPVGTRKICFTLCPWQRMASIAV